MNITLDTLQTWAVMHGYIPGANTTAYLRAYGRSYSRGLAGTHDHANDNGRVGAEGPGDDGHAGRSRENGPGLHPVRDLAFPGRAA